MFDGPVARWPISEQWETVRQQTPINTRLIVPAGGGTPADSGGDRKIREVENVILFLCASADKHVKSKVTKALRRRDHLWPGCLLIGPSLSVSVSVCVVVRPKAVKLR